MRYPWATGCLLLAACAAVAAEREEERWVCVPTEDREWRCGRGAHAPEPKPLPPAAPPGGPPEGYTPRERGARVPGYLLDPNLPAEREETAAADAEPADETADRPSPTSPAPETAQAPEPRASAETDPAPEPRPSADPETATEPAAATAPEGDRPARYGIQVAAARDPDSLTAYRRELEQSGLDVYQRAWEDAGGTWHVLLAGRYASAAEAQRALNEIPESLRPAGAWVRPLDSLN